MMLTASLARPMSHGSADEQWLPVLDVGAYLAGEPGALESLAAELRAGDPPLFTRIHEGALVLDPRTRLPGESEQVLSAFRDLN